MTPSRPSIHVGLFDGIGHMGLGQALSILMRNDTFPSLCLCGLALVGLAFAPCVYLVLYVGLGGARYVSFLILTVTDYFFQGMSFVPTTCIVSRRVDLYFI